MAVHNSLSSMLEESLKEILLVVEYCVNFQKDYKIWGSYGCYGYPAALMLFSIADGIGSYVLGGTTKDHFKILNHKDYYDLNLDDFFIGIIYKEYRCFLIHNLILFPGLLLDIGEEKDSIFALKNGTPVLKLRPFLNKTKEVVSKFLEIPENINKVNQLGGSLLEDSQNEKFS